MSTELTVFQNTEFGELDILVEGEKIYFPATKCAEILGYVKPHKAIQDHCRYTLKRGVPHPQSPEKTIEMNFISEGDLYRLIANSKLPTAEIFEKWVFDDVLPSIRQHGAYMTPETIEKVLTDPDFIIGLATRLKEAQTALLIAQPKAEYFDALVSRNLLTNFRDTAKEIGVGEKAFVRFLIENGYVYRAQNGQLKPYAQFADKQDGLFSIKDCMSNTNGKWAGNQTMITPKGKETFRLLIRQADQM